MRSVLTLDRQGTCGHGVANHRLSSTGYARLVFLTLWWRMHGKDFEKLASRFAHLSQCYVLSPETRHQHCEMTTFHLLSRSGRSLGGPTTSTPGRVAKLYRDFCGGIAKRR